MRVGRWMPSPLVVDFPPLSDWAPGPRGQVEDAQYRRTAGGAGMWLQMLAIERSLIHN